MMSCKNWMTEEKLSVVMAIAKGDISVTEICRQHQVTITNVYRWRDQFLEAGKKALSDERTKQGRDPLAEENLRLKELIGRMN